jgi:bacteriorhodopsin
VGLGSALSMRNVLQVVGVTPVGVMIMYLCMSLLVLLSAALVGRGCSEPDTHQKELLYSAFFIAAISAACYLTMATGNGLLVLRKSGTGLKATWAYSNPLMATEGDEKHPNPLYDRAYARAPTYPFFYTRSIQRMLTSPMMVHYICQVVGVPRSTTWSLLFTSVMT